MPIKPSKVFEVYEDRNRLYTKNLTPGKTFFNERTSGEFREWDPKRSKLAAAIVKGCSNVFLRKGSNVLYLGAAHGYTPSYVSDIIGKDGFLFGIDPAPRVVRDLVFLSKVRSNIVPILADANHIDGYADKVCQVDVVFQDIAQRNQADIFLKNCDYFLRPGGYGLFAVKARSIDVAQKPKTIFNEVRKELEKKMAVVDYKILDPLQKDHAFFVCKKK